MNNHFAESITVAIITIIIGLIIIIAGISFINSLQKRQPSLPYDQIIDCWHGEQVETPRVKFIVSYPVTGNYCLIIPSNTSDF